MTEGKPMADDKPATPQMCPHCGSMSKSVFPGSDGCTFENHHDWHDSLEQPDDRQNPPTVTTPTNFVSESGVKDNVQVARKLLNSLSSYKCLSCGLTTGSSEAVPARDFDTFWREFWKSPSERVMSDHHYTGYYANHAPAHIRRFADAYARSVAAPAPSHLAIDCTSRTCAIHRDTWRHYEDNIACAPAPGLAEALRPCYVYLKTMLTSPRWAEHLNASVREDIGAIVAEAERVIAEGKERG